MHSFDEFIALPSTQDTLKSISEDLEGFIQEVEKLDPLPIRQRLTAWLANFKDLEGVNYEVLLQLLRSIHFYNDDRVDDSFRKTLLRYATSRGLSKDLSNFYLCPLGNDTESSFRIITNFNENRPPYLFTDINGLLKRIDTADNSFIVFLDDIIQTGGQLNSIFKRYLGIPLEPGETKDEYEHRVEIETKRLKDVFRSKKILLFFFNTFVEGQDKIHEVLRKQLGLDVEILVGNDVQPSNKGFFGTPNDIEHIINESTKAFIDGPLKGKQYKDITQTYFLLKEAGYQLLKADRIKKEINKRESERWPEEFYRNRSLGYANGAKLFIGHQNVPTSTITALWLPTPENKDKAITIQGKEVIWSPLFYRKTKKLPETSRKTNEIYPRIPVNKILEIPPLVDINLYDFLTIICLQRKSALLIYGHDKYEIKDLVKTLDQIEEDFFDKRKPSFELQKREWLQFSISQANLTTTYQEVDDSIKGLKKTSIGIVLNIDPNIMSGRSIFFQSLVSQLHDNYPSKIFTLIIDYPSRNHESLKAIKKLLSPIKTAEIYVSTQIFVEQLPAHNSTSIFDDENSFENIVYYLENILSVKTNFKDLVKQDLKSFEEIKPDLKKSNRLKLDYLSPATLIFEIENVISKSNINQVNWSSFYKELLFVCSKYTPELIEHLIYYSAKSNSKFIRFESLKFTFEGSRKYLIDYWVEATEGDKIFYKNILDEIKTPAYHLLYPLLRYYNKNKPNEGLGKKILEIINEDLNGKYFEDYWLVEKILNHQEKNFAINLLTDHVDTINKLLRSGVDLFEEVDDVNSNLNVMSNEMAEKVILSSKMSSKKITVIFEHYQHLISNH